MDKADEIAEQVITDMDCDSCQHTLEMRKEMTVLVASSLRTYADERVAPLQTIVDEQAADEGLWFMAQYASESYLQQELRRLHTAIEALKTGGKV